MDSRSDSGADPGIGRREFLKAAAVTGAGLAAGVVGVRQAAAAEAKATGTAAAQAGAKSDAGAKSTATAAAEPKLERRNEKPDIVYKRIGRTNLALSTIAFGGVELAPERMSSFDAAMDAGVNFGMFPFGKCAETLAGWLKKPGNRDRLFIGGTANPKEVDKLLKEYGGIECIDILMPGFHSGQHAASDEFYKQFQDLKKAGKVRFLCLTSHANVPETWKAAVKTDFYDGMCMPYNFSTRGDLKALIADARKKDMGLACMKSLQGQPGNQDAVGVWRTLAADGMDVVIHRISDKKSLDQCLSFARGPAAPAGKVAAVDCSGLCSLCGACAACPRNLAIQDTLRTWQYYGVQMGRLDQARAQYALVPAAARASECADCGRCEAVCPRDLNVRQLMREAHAALA
jgi:uncharacterized protein